MQELTGGVLVNYLWDAVQVKGLDRKYVTEVDSRLKRGQEAIELVEKSMSYAPLPERTLLYTPLPERTLPLKRRLFEK